MPGRSEITRLHKNGVPCIAACPNYVLDLQFYMFTFHEALPIKSTTQLDFTTCTTMTGLLKVFGFAGRRVGALVRWFKVLGSQFGVAGRELNGVGFLLQQTTTLNFNKNPGLSNTKHLDRP